jgi:hypothetical protein
MLVDVTLVGVMQMPVVQIIDVSVVLHLFMRAAGAMLVLVLVVYGVFHSSSPTAWLGIAPVA